MWIPMTLNLISWKLLFFFGFSFFTLTRSQCWSWILVKLKYRLLIKRRWSTCYANGWRQIKDAQTCDYGPSGEEEGVIQLSCHSRRALSLSFLVLQSSLILPAAPPRLQTMLKTVAGWLLSNCQPHCLLRVRLRLSSVLINGRWHSWPGNEEGWPPLLASLNNIIQVDRTEESRRWGMLWPRRRRRRKRRRGTG